MSIIEIKKISKKYNISGKIGGYISLRDNISKMLKDPFSLFKKNKYGNFLALDDVSFNVESGDVLGIIGSNGAGKSTLLKILSKITSPTSGEVRIKGKVASLLEVGTGFHPELSGKENIFLNGAIMGMSKSDIVKNFKEIVEFSGVEKFLDMPVKHYSSGMYVRLAFSVAAHMKSDVLLIDEILAVGDIEFQKKCLVKIDSLTKDKKKTVIFISHNMTNILNLCNKCILLKNGKLIAQGETKEVVNKYLNQGESSSLINLSNINFFSNDYELLSFELVDGLSGVFTIYSDSPIKIKIKFRAKRNINYLSFVVGCKTLEGLPLFSVRDIDYIDKQFTFKQGLEYEIELEINHGLTQGKYVLALDVLGGDKNYANYQLATLEIIGPKEGGSPIYNNGIINCNAVWKSIEIK